MPFVIPAPTLRAQPVSVTRQMAAALIRLEAEAKAKGQVLHHLGAGYPHPEVSDPSLWIAQKRGYFQHVAQAGGGLLEQNLPPLMSKLYNYTDTMGPPTARAAFARVYGHDFGFTIDPDMCVPTIGATGGIAMLCSLFEHAGEPIAYIVDAPTYTGLLSRAQLYHKASFYSVPLDPEGPDPQLMAAQIDNARADGKVVAFYYTVTDGHNPGGISFSQRRRQAILEVCRQKGVLIVEDAPYTYISYENPEDRPRPLVAMAPDQVVHLFTASKIGLPGPRVGMAIAQARVSLADGREVSVRELLVSESAGSVLFHNPESLRAFEAYLTDSRFVPRDSLWPIAATKNAVYSENRRILLDGLQHFLGDHPELFGWTEPGAGFFSVFTFKAGDLCTDAAFVERLVAEFGVVVIPMFGFYSADARARDPGVGLDQVRLSFCYSPSTGAARVREISAAVEAFGRAIRSLSGLPPVS
ncbi:MAG: pyridoxal phosphate-dependent aminotransferase [Pseudomonadota bacterium]